MDFQSLEDLQRLRWTMALSGLAHRRMACKVAAQGRAGEAALQRAKARDHFHLARQLDESIAEIRQLGLQRRFMQRFLFSS